VAELHGPADWTAKLGLLALADRLVSLIANYAATVASAGVAPGHDVVASKTSSGVWSSSA
jgi:hypothetical protein